MKIIRKLSAFLVVALILAFMTVPAFAYDQVTPSSKVEITEKLTIKNGDTVPNATYTYAVSGTVGVYTKDGVSYGSTTAVTGAPKFTTDKNSVTFHNSSAKTIVEGKTVVSGTVELDFSEVKINQPGIYYWKVSKTVDPNTDVHLTNNREVLFAVVRVIDENGTLKVDNYGLVHSDGQTSAQPNVSGKTTEVDDEYSGEQHDLTLSKTVSGSLASKEEYFKFTVTINNANSVGGHALTINTTNGKGTPAAVYYGEDASINNPTSISIDSSGNGTVGVWLKHGESITIKDIPDGVKYTITEDSTHLNGYTPSIDMTGDPADSYTAPTVTDNSLNADATVKYTNTKDSTTPTGIILQAAAPIAGILIVVALGAVVIISKRRRA